MNWWRQWLSVLHDETFLEIHWMDEWYRVFAPTAEMRKTLRHFYHDLFSLFHGHDWRSEELYITGSHTLLKKL